MSLIFLLLGPTVMIYLGLHIADSVPLTFLLFYGWLAGVPLFAVLTGQRLSLRPALRRFGLKNDAASLRAGFWTGAVCLLGIFGGISWLRPYFFDVAYLRTLLQEWEFTGPYIYGMVFILLLVNPFLEEIYWRGFLTVKLKGQYPFWCVNLVTAAAYCLYHILSIAPMFKWPLNVIGAGPVFLAGLLWGWLRHRYDSLAGPILSHMLADAGIMLVYFRFLR